MFAGYEQVYGRPRATVMTVQGTIGKTFALLAILSATAIWSWYAATAPASSSRSCCRPPAIGGFILAMITIFKPTPRPVDRADLRGVRGRLPRRHLVR